MGDQDGRHAALGRNPGQKVHHDLLRRDIEAGGRLVGDQQGRIAGNRHGDHHALAHAAGEFVRVSGHSLFGVANLHSAQQLQRLRARFIPGHSLMGRNRIGDLVPDGTDRIERRTRVLEDHCHRRAVQMAEITPRYPRDVLPAKPDLACRDTAGRIEQPRDRKAGDGFSRAALADEAEHLALAERQRDATHRLDKATPCREGDLQVA